MSENAPTPEQAQIIDTFVAGDNLVIEAGAGTGKTSTLRMMAEATDSRGIYIAYNKAIADDAKGSFPATVQAATAHSFAFRAKGYLYKERLNGPRVTGRQAAQFLGINIPFQVNDTVLRPDTIARMVMDTVNRFCYSADSEIKSYHVAKVPGAEAVMDDLRTMILPFARKAWADLSGLRGNLKFQHDHYLKLWAMDEPKLACDFVLLDEAQDANPVIAQVVEAQDHAQKIMVGDRSQAIYGWRGAVDAMTNFDADQRLMLSQSFRFGPAVAVEANKWLDLLDAPLRLSGFEKIDSTVESLDDPDAILCRTNAEVIARAISAIEKGRKAAIVGGTQQIKSLASAAIDLQVKGSTWHPDLIAFSSWDELRTYVNEDQAGRDLKVFVNLIDKYGAHKVIEIADASVNENDADVILSTAHKAKGREWDTVQIAPDFAPSKDSSETASVSRPEMMLNYVAVTRARQVLDNAGLAWVDELV